MADTQTHLSFGAWLRRLLTPRRSFAYRDLEERYAEQRGELLKARALVSTMYNYILIYQAHLPPVERPEPKTVNPDAVSDQVTARTVSARPRLSQIHQKYRSQAEAQRAQQGPRPVSVQRERVAEAVAGKSEDTEEVDLARSIDDAARFIADKAS